MDDLTAPPGPAQPGDRAAAEGAALSVRVMLEALPVPVSWAASDGRILFWNRSAQDVFGYSPDDVPTIAAWYLLAYPDESYRASTVTRWEQALCAARQQPGGIRFGPVTVQAKQGHWVDVEINGTFVEEYLLVTFYDVTDRLRVERALREREQADRLDSVGRLAGGVAHDFNNLLTIIQGNLALALEALPQGHAVRAELEQTREASNRAATLTRQLLAFGGVQVLSTRAVDLNLALRNLRDLLTSVLGEVVEISWQLAEGLQSAMVDQTQFEQVVLTLALNARDAMPSGGRLTIETRAIESAGARYARLCVSDTGQGMPAEVTARIFEPFFTTKERGTSSGMGLASAYGIVRQSGGRIEVSSKVGSGTTFHVDFPLAGAEATPRPSAQPAYCKHERQKVVLVAEDEETLGRMVQRILARAGYHVLLSTSAAAAEQKVREFPGKIDLLLTDVVMPGDSGIVLTERLLGRLPDLRILFMSGFPGDAVAQHGLGTYSQFFLAKPFTPALLIQKVAEVIAFEG